MQRDNDVSLYGVKLAEGLWPLPLMVGVFAMVLLGLSILSCGQPETRRADKLISQFGAPAVRAILVDDQGRAVSRACAMLRGWDATAKRVVALFAPDSDGAGPKPVGRGGSVEFAVPYPGSYVLEIHATGFAPGWSAPFAVASDDGIVEMDIVLVRGGTVRGVVVSEATDEPVGDAEVTTTLIATESPRPFERQFWGHPNLRVVVRSGSRGSFELQCVPPGLQKILVFPRDRTPWLIGEFDLENGGEVDLRTCRIPQGVAVGGVVQGPDSLGGQIRVRVLSVADYSAELGHSVSIEAEADARGRFTLPKRLCPGEWRIDATRSGSDLMQVVRDRAASGQVFTVGVDDRAAKDLVLQLPERGGD